MNQRSPLPTEKDGVFPNGTIINASNGWTKPTASIPASSSAFNYSAQCTLYVVQSGYGDPAMYQAWVRDASDAAIGGLPTSKIGATAQFPAGGGVMTLGSIPPKYETEPAKVVASWDAWGMPAIALAFDPKTNQGSPGCGFSGSTEGDEVTFFQCRFGCSPQGDD
ncbi:MAG: hypothetical protein Q9161_007851 [Pseudevernia consocians]